MVFWTAGFVLLTLLINAPLLPTVLRLTGLSKVPDKQLARRQRAVAALREHTTSVLEQLRDAEDELLAGMERPANGACNCKSLGVLESSVLVRLSLQWGAEQSATEFKQLRDATG